MSPRGENIEKSIKVDEVLGAEAETTEETSPEAMAVCEQCNPQLDIDENQILTLNESVSLISRDLLNDEIQSSLIDELDTKYVIVSNAVTASTSAETASREEKEEELINKDIMEMRRQLIASRSWPRVWGAEAAPERFSMKPVENIGVGGTHTETSSASYTSSGNEDKSYQVNAIDLPGAMVHTHTQMTPPVSPEPITFVHTHRPVTKRSVATETDGSGQTDNLLNEKAISREERRLRRKLFERENELKSISIATQTCDIGLVVNVKPTPPSELSWNLIEEEVCLILFYFSLSQVYSL